MSDHIPSLDEFKSQIEALSNNPLDGEVSAAVEDFWQHWSAFASLINEHSLAINIDTLRLRMAFPQYNRYNEWKGAGWIAISFGIVSAWFYWQLGSVLIAIGICLDLWGRRCRFVDAKKFSEEIMNEATLIPADGGYAKLCASYIAGIVQFGSPFGSAHWPQHPSNAVTGEQSFIST